ncbi:ubiquitin carboxyl-terminal hydrolase 8-like isoform X1 [Metopolophium dirhodum]|uniref:ubiquitin carboxyl-terminal hydrolase 8-like isoform X1 n=1 Tax=Metopolophium dirhodum TaxID=44670 RepID=UPI00299061EC|nr:ubiquitin carboxyl-terminal hydrolase 8-like isoform X1 [Metopolophium dirhodum]XP_060876080.1 ubiquitin carboxyl-terminal hydrolase 8-like isoform X1 [Metopolophium dirhodum]
MRNKKDLHLAGCLVDLNSKTEIPDKIKDLDVISLNKKAELMFEKAMIANNENDEEVVYIYLMKYCQILQVMKKTFTNDKNYIDLMYKDNLKKAIKMLTYIKESLERRYNEKTKEEDNNKLIKRSSQNRKRFEEKLNFEFESTITNKNLLYLLDNTDKKKICLLDTRPSDIFNNNKIISCDVINIPKEHLVLGLTPAILTTKLEDQFKEIWKNRHNYNYIVILDQGTEDIDDDQRLLNLKNALLKWDSACDNSKKLKFLRGGYEDFNHLCPWKTTQNNILKSNKDVEPLSDIELDPEPEYEEHENKQIQYPSLGTVQNDLARLKINSTFHNGITTNIKSKLDHRDNYSSEEDIDPQELTHTPINKPQLPIFDRSTKPHVKINQFMNPEIIKPLYKNNDELDDENNEIPNNIEQLENRRLSLENSFLENIDSYVRDYKNQDTDLNSIPRVDRSTKPSDDLLIVSRTKIIGGDGLRGLQNLGNTCYMNSILQCLSSTEDLVKYFINIYSNFTNYKSRTKGLVAKEFSNVIKNLWSQSGRGFQSQQFKDTIGEYKDMFKHYDQQDSHEFLTILLDWLHDDLNQPEDNRVILGASKETGEEDWGNWTKANNSIIQQLFYGQQKSTVSCDTCFEKSVTFEPFLSLSLPLPSEGNKCTLSDCLQLYLNGESICGWHCPKCKRSRDATKKLDIMRLPPYLIIHLKRFSSNGYKKNSNVEFPKMNLDMSNFINGLEHRNWKYCLYGVSNHSGSLDGGHYTASCLKNSINKWYKFDDVRVYEIDSSTICSPEAYILFYRRKN